MSASDSDRSSKLHKNRFKFMNTIRQNMPGTTNTFLVLPKEHWLNPDLFILRPNFGKILIFNFKNINR